MSGPFGVLDVAASGVNVANTWLAATSDNIANLNTVRAPGVEPYRAKQLIVAPQYDGGVAVQQTTEDAAAPDRVYDPGHPLADADGYLTRPVVDLATEMTNLLMAQRLFQVNLNVHKAGVATYQSALQIGAGR